MPKTLPFSLQQHITEFLAALPNLHSSTAQQAFLYSIGLDWGLQQKITVGSAPTEFVKILVATVSAYGNLADGRDAVVAVLEAAKPYLGADRRAVCQQLIEEIEACQRIAAPRPQAHASSQTTEAGEEIDFQDEQSNPYNCTIPGKLFVGYESLRRRLLLGLRNGNSYALLGGRRCGKTSFLLQLEKDVKAQTEFLRPYQPLPRYLDMQGCSQLTPAFLFKTIYALIVQELDAAPWREGIPGEEYQTFLAHMDAAQPAIEAHYGVHWLVVLLVDEMDAALAKLPDDQFFQNLRNLLMVSDFRRHFRLVASGVKEMSKLILSGSSPLNNLRRHHLRVLTATEIDMLIQAGFPQGCADPIKVRLLELTGGHPYLTQGLLEELWFDRETVNEAMVKRAGREFLNQHSDFDHWLFAFGQAEQAIYQNLCQASGGTLSLEVLRQRVAPEILPDLDEALLVLSYHGVINLADPDQPKLVGTLFREWYQVKTCQSKR
jgi:hypothetical protein